MTAQGSPDGALFPQPVLDALAHDPRRAAFEHGSRTVPGGELLGTVRRLVSGMRAAGLGPGKGVALTTGVTPEGFAANLAAHALGCRVAGLRPAWSRLQLAGVLSRGIDAVIGDPSTLTPELLSDAGAAAILSLGPCPGAVDLLGGPDSDDPVRTEASPDDIARVNFTSGSTGRPKGCARTYRTFSLAYRPDGWAPELARLIGHLDRLLVYGSWSMPVMLTFAGRCLVTGGTVLIHDRDPWPTFAQVLHDRRATAVAMTPPGLHRTLAQVRAGAIELRDLRALVVSGSPARPDLLSSAVEQLGPVVWQGYGQAESGMISLLSPDAISERPEAALESVGRPLSDVELRIHDPDGGPARPGAAGEIWVRSRHVMAGYWDDDRLTAEVLQDGWLHTQDVGCLDGDGFLRLTGRSRDVIMVNGEVCYPGAIEQVLCRHPGVEQAYVVGVPDDRTGEAIHAFILPAEGRSPDRHALNGLIRASLTAAHVPATVTLLRDVPLGSGGKPDKRALAESITHRASPAFG